MEIVRATCTVLHRGQGKCAEQPTLAQDQKDIKASMSATGKKNHGDQMIDITEHPMLRTLWENLGKVEQQQKLIKELQQQVDELRKELEKAKKDS